MSACCRLHIHLPMDVLSPEGTETKIEGIVPATAVENGSTVEEKVEEGGEIEEKAEGSEPTEEVKRPPSPQPTAQQARGKHGSSRKPRTKGLVKKLQEQIEFYFGDANLPKDKFLRQKIKDHPERYVGVDVIASFKKIQALTSDRSLVLKAIQGSTLLELSEDKLWLRRVSPLPSQSRSDVDSRTIYVENLSPTDTDHDSVRNMFKLFGKITYVSLPRHKISDQIKGFAFVEFSTTEEAKAALEYFATKDKTPRSRKSSTVNKKEENEESQMETVTGDEGTDKKPEDPPTSSDGVAMEKEVDGEGEGVTRRGEKRGREEEGDGSQPSAKRPKSEPEGGVVSTSDKSSHFKSRLESQSSESDLDGTINEGKDEPKKKKNRQHKKKQWASILRDRNLRVMSKNDWLDMKKVYHDLQKSHMKQLKMERGIGAASDGVTLKKKGFVTNCLVKVTCASESGADVERLKVFCSKFGEVAYMDIKDKDNEGYIRFRNSGCVEALLQSEGVTNVSFAGVSEEDERAYFLKSQAQRKQMFLKRGRNVRGRDKLISKVLRNQGPAAVDESAENDTKRDPKSIQERTHIRFSDSDSEPDPSTA